MSNKGIKMSDCRFYVNEDERVVVCVIPNTTDLLIDFIMEHFEYSDFDVFEGLQTWQSSVRKRLELPYCFTGKAVCAEGDEWNEELGKKIAFYRAKDKCYKSFFRHANLLVNLVDRRLTQMIDTLNTFGMKLDYKRAALEKYINEAFNAGDDEHGDELST